MDHFLVRHLAANAIFYRIAYDVFLIKKKHQRQLHAKIDLRVLQASEPNKAFTVFTTHEF